MATLFVDKLDPQSGTALEIGTSGDTVTVPSGATFNVAGTLQSGGAAVANTPTFRVSGPNLSVAHNTTTKCTVNTEVFDVGGCFDLGGNDRFTPNVSGKYLIIARLEMPSATNTDYFLTVFYKNGGSIGGPAIVNRDYQGTFAAQLVEANGSSDYFEVYTQQQSGGSLNISLQEFSGFKLIE